MKHTLLAAAAALLVFSGSALRAGPVAPSPAPAWTLKDADGNSVSSSQFKGKVVVLDFWATWCPPCRHEIPGYVSLQAKYADKGLVIIGVSVDEPGKDRDAMVKKFMADKGMNYKVVFADDSVIGAFGGIEAIPTTFIIDRDGNIRNKKVGAEDTADYEKELLKILLPAG